MSRIGSPASRRLSASLTWCSVGFGGRPIFTRVPWHARGLRLSACGLVHIQTRLRHRIGAYAVPDRSADAPLPFQPAPPVLGALLLALLGDVLPSLLCEDF